MYDDDNGDNFLLVVSKKGDNTCKLCNILFANKSNFKKHMKNKHEGYDANNPNRLVFGKSVFIVSEEEKVMPENEVVINNTHEIVEEILKTVISPIENKTDLKFSCNVCLKSFPKKYILNKHAIIYEININFSKNCFLFDSRYVLTSYFIVININPTKRDPS